MTEGKRDIEFYRARPEEYAITKTGSVQDKTTGQFVASFPELNPSAWTAETSREFHRKRKAASNLSMMKHRIKVINEELADEGIQLPDPETIFTEDELIAADGEADGVIFGLYIRAYIRAAKQAKPNFKGLSEGVKTALNPFAEDPKAPLPSVPGKISGSPDALMSLVYMIEEDRRLAVEKARAIEVEQRGGIQ